MDILFKVLRILSSIVHCAKNTIMGFVSIRYFQIAADVKEVFLWNFLYILIIFKWQIHKDDLSKLNFRW